jgi:hypothetical protein
MATTCIGPPRLGVFVATRCPGMGCSEENNECQRGLGRVDNQANQIMAEAKCRKAMKLRAVFS